MSYLVGNPEDRFSCKVAHITMITAFAAFIVPCFH